MGWVMFIGILKSLFLPFLQKRILLIRRSSWFYSSTSAFWYSSLLLEDFSFLAAVIHLSKVRFLVLSFFSFTNVVRNECFICVFTFIFIFISYTLFCFIYLFIYIYFLLWLIWNGKFSSLLKIYGVHVFGSIFNHNNSLFNAVSLIYFFFSSSVKKSFINLNILYIISLAFLFLLSKGRNRFCTFILLFL